MTEGGRIRRRESNIPVPLVFPAFYLTMIVLAGYALGVQLINPFEGMFTGYAVYPLRENGTYQEPAALENNIAPFEGDKLRVTSTGFLLIEPIPGTTKISKDGRLKVKYIKPLPVDVEVDTYRVVNHYTGKGCTDHDINYFVPAGQDFFEAVSAGCDMTAPPESKNVLTYDIIVKYSFPVGNVEATKTSTGQLHILLE